MPLLLYSIMIMESTILNYKWSTGIRCKSHCEFSFIGVFNRFSQLILVYGIQGLTGKLVVFFSPYNKPTITNKNVSGKKQVECGCYMFAFSIQHCSFIVEEQQLLKTAIIQLSFVETSHMPTTIKQSRYVQLLSIHI